MQKGQTKVLRERFILEQCVRSAALLPPSLCFSCLLQYLAASDAPPDGPLHMSASLVCTVQLNFKQKRQLP